MLREATTRIHNVCARIQRTNINEMMINRMWKVVTSPAPPKWVPAHAHQVERLNVHKSGSMILQTRRQPGQHQLIAIFGSSSPGTKTRNIPESGKMQLIPSRKLIDALRMLPRLVTLPILGPVTCGTRYVQKRPAIQYQFSTDCSAFL